REAERVQPEARDDVDVLLVAVVAVARVARRLAEDRRLQVLEPPLVAVDVVALDLVCRRRGAPEKALRKAAGRPRQRRGGDVGTARGRVESRGGQTRGEEPAT